MQVKKPEYSQPTSFNHRARIFAWGVIKIDFIASTFPSIPIQLFRICSIPLSRICTYRICWYSFFADGIDTNTRLPRPRVTIRVVGEFGVDRDKACSNEVLSHVFHSTKTSQPFSHSVSDPLLPPFSLPLSFYIIAESGHTDTYHSIE